MMSRKMTQPEIILNLRDQNYTCTTDFRNQVADWIEHISGERDSLVSMWNKEISKLNTIKEIVSE